MEAFDEQTYFTYNFNIKYKKIKGTKIKISRFFSVSVNEIFISR